MNEFTNDNIAQKELFELAKKKVKKQRDFIIHLFIYAIAMTIWVLKRYAGIHLDFFPIRYINWFVMSIWTVAIAIQAIELFFSEVILGRKWEERKVRSLMKEESKRQNWE